MNTSVCGGLLYTPKSTAIWCCVYLLNIRLGRCIVESLGMNR